MSMPWRRQKSTAISASSSKLVRLPAASFCAIDSSFERLRRRLQADKGGLDRARLRKQFQRRRR